MTTIHIVTFYAILGTLLLIGFIAGYKCAGYYYGKCKNAPDVSPNKKA